MAVLKTAFAFMANVGSNPTPSANQKKRGLAGPPVDFGHRIEFCVCGRFGKKSGVKYTILTKS